MSVLEIVRWPDERLGVVCNEIASFGPEVAELAQDMLETMYAAPGRGLAAPQIGVLSRVFVMDATWKEGVAEPLVFVNPEIKSESPVLVEQQEGCLSIPGITVGVTRPETVRLRWSTLSGGTEERDFSGFSAACVQHELDHLNGVVTLDRVTAEMREQAMTAYRQVSG